MNSDQFNVLKFYSRQELQTFRRERNRAPGTMQFRMYAPNHLFLPFYLTYQGKTISAIRLMDLKDNIIQTITTNIANDWLQFTDDCGMVHGIYLGNKQIASPLLCGDRYIRIKFSDDSYLYSEAFTIFDFLQGYDGEDPPFQSKDLLRLEFWHSGDLADIAYSKGYKQRLYLDRPLGLWQYEREVDALKTEKNDTIEKASSVAKFATLDLGLLPEFMLDAMHFMLLHDEKWIEDGYGDSWEIREPSIEVGEYQVDGLMAPTKLRFLIRRIFRTNCALPVDVDCGGGLPEGDFSDHDFPGSYD